MARQNDYGTWSLKIDGKPYTLEYEPGRVELRPGKGKGKEPNARMRDLGLHLHGLRGTARISGKTFALFLHPVAAHHNDILREDIPAACGGCGEEGGPGCAACERLSSGRFRYDAVNVLGVVVRRIDLSFSYDDWHKSLKLARVVVPFRGKDQNAVEQECLLVEVGEHKRVYLAAHESWRQEGMPRWRKQRSLFEEIDDEVLQDGRAVVRGADEAPRGDSLPQQQAAPPGDGGGALGQGRQARLLLDER